jgi:hypothetical protein
MAGVAVPQPRDYVSGPGVPTRMVRAASLAPVRPRLRSWFDYAQLLYFYIRSRSFFNILVASSIISLPVFFCLVKSKTAATNGSLSCPLSPINKCIV